MASPVAGKSLRGALPRWRPGGRVLDLFTMRRKPIARWLRVGLATATWAVTVALVEGSAESEYGRTTRPLGESTELQLRSMDRGHGIAPQQAPPPERSHDESIEP